MRWKRRRCLLGLWVMMGVLEVMSSWMLGAICDERGGDRERSLEQGGEGMEMEDEKAAG